MKSANAIFSIAIGMIIALWMGFHIFSSYQPVSAACELLPVVGLFLGFASIAMAVIYLTLVTSFMGWIIQLLFVELGYVGSFSESMLMLSLALCVFGALIKSILVNQLSDPLFRNILGFFTIVCIIVIGLTIKQYGLSMSGASASMASAPWLMIPVAFYRRDPRQVETILKWAVIASLPALISFAFAIRQRYWGLNAFEELFWVGNYGIMAIGGDPRIPEAPGLTFNAPVLSRFAALVGGYGILGCFLFKSRESRSTFLWIASLMLIVGGFMGLMGAGRRFGYAFVFLLPIALFIVRRKGLTMLSYGALMGVIGLMVFQSERAESWVTDAAKDMNQAKVGTTLEAGSDRDAITGIGTFNTRIRTFAQLADPGSYSLLGIPVNRRTPEQLDAHGLPVQILLASGVVGLGFFVCFGFGALFLFHRALFRLGGAVGVIERVGFVAGVIVLLQASFFVAGQKAGTNAVGMIPIMTHLSIAICAIAHQRSYMSSTKSTRSTQLDAMPGQSMALGRG